MSAALVPVEKRCGKCGKVKPASDFYRAQRRATGLSSYCKPCQRADTRERTAKRRAEMGEEAWLAYQRDGVRASRERTGNARGRAYSRAARRAAKRLAELHPREWEHLLAVEL